MGLRDYIKVLRDQWKLFVAFILILVMSSAGVWLIRPKEFTASLTLYVSAQASDNTQTAYQGAQLSQERVTSYVELVASTRVTDQVVQQLNLPLTSQQLSRKISASSALDSVLINVAVTDESPQQASAIVNRVGTVFAALVDELERPTSPGTVSPIVVRVVQPAAVPTSPSSSGLLVTLAIGLALGIVVGLGIVLVRHALDNSIKSPDQLRDISGAPGLGVIAYDSGVPMRPLTVSEDSHSPRAEAFRQLRTNLQYVNIDNFPKVIALTSSMPGEGKTTTLANLAITLASAGHRVLVIEADLRRPRLADILGLDRTVGLTSVLTGRISISQAIQQWSIAGISVLASGPLPPNPSELLASHNMASVIAELRQEFDMVLIDTPPLLPVTDAAAIAPATDGVVLVCRFKETKIDQARSAVAALQSVSATLLGTVFTMVPPTGQHAYAQYNSYYPSRGPARPGDSTGTEPGEQSSHAAKLNQFSQAKSIFKSKK